jgi:hypothetical protein
LIEDDRRYDIAPLLFAVEHIGPVLTEDRPFNDAKAFGTLRS